MDEKYQKLMEALKYCYIRAGYLMEDFSQKDKDLSDIVRNMDKIADDTPSSISEEKWMTFLNKHKDNDAVLYAYVCAKNVPLKVIQQALLNATVPETCLRGLERDFNLGSKVYDHCLKIARTDISAVLTQCYTTPSYHPFKIPQLPFNRNAINYYAEKQFMSPKMKNGKLLMFATFADDKNVIQKMLNCPYLNETRLNYLINNPYIPDTIKNELFEGKETATDFVIPDCNAIFNPTHKMIEAIYLSRIEGFTMAREHSERVTLDSQLSDMILHNQLTEGMEKDFISRYQPGDEMHRDLLKYLLRFTKNTGTIEFAKSLDYRIFDSVIENRNIPKDFYNKVGIYHMNQLFTHIKKLGHIPAGIYELGKILNNVPIDKKYFKELASIHDVRIDQLLALSPNTPKEVLQEVAERPTSCLTDENTRLTARVNLLLRERAVRPEDILSINKAFMYQLSCVCPTVENTSYGVLLGVYTNLAKYNKTDVLDDIQEQLPDCNTSKEIKTIKNYLFCKELLDTKQERDIKGDNIKQKSSDQLNTIRNECVENYSTCKTLGAVYQAIDDSKIDKLIQVINELKERENKIPTCEYLH